MFSLMEVQSVSLYTMCEWSWSAGGKSPTKAESLQKNGGQLYFSLYLNPATVAGHTARCGAASMKGSWQDDWRTRPSPPISWEGYLSCGPAPLHQSAMGAGPHKRLPS